MHSGALVVERLAQLAHAFLARAQASKVFRGFWGHIRKQFDDHPSS